MKSLVDVFSDMGKKRKSQNQKEKRAKKRREREEWEATPILEKTGMVSFKSAGKHMSLK